MFSACLPGDEVIGNTNLSTFHFTFSSSEPLPMPKGRQKRNGKVKGTELKRARKRRTRRSETVKGERTRGNVFFYGNVSLNLIKAA